MNDINSAIEEILHDVIINDKYDKSDNDDECSYDYFLMEELSDSDDSTNDVVSIVVDDVKHMEDTIKSSYVNLTGDTITKNYDIMCYHVIDYLERFNDKIFMFNLHDNPNKIFHCHADEKKLQLIKNWENVHVSEMHDRIYTITMGLQQDNVIKLICPEILSELRRFDEFNYSKKVNIYTRFVTDLIESFKFFC